MFKSLSSVPEYVAVQQCHTHCCTVYLLFLLAEGDQGKGVSPSPPHLDQISSRFLVDHGRVCVCGGGDI